MPKGKIIDIKNNYGLIYTDAYKVKNEQIPFKIKPSMLIEKEGNQYIKYTEEVDFTLSHSQGIRERDIKEATNIKFIGDNWKYKERIIEINYFQNIKNRLNKYNFFYPELNDNDFSKWLSENNFQPRMLEYLTPGIFVSKEIIKIASERPIDLNEYNSKFKIKLLFAIDRIDIKFRKHILSWVIGIENTYKTYFSKISISKDGQNIANEAIKRWGNKKPKVIKLIKRARNKRLYRDTSDEFDYLSHENSVPLFDFMEQLDLSELSEITSIFYEIYNEKGKVPETLQKMQKCISFIGDICALRNAAAHGRSILPMFMDPDYNGNWDLEFDNIENRTNVEKWLLFNLLKAKWEAMGLGEHSKQIINTLYGNPIRKAWIELNYLYFYIIQKVEENSFELFVNEAQWFLSKEENLHQQIKNVNLLNLRLSDMGNTTLNISPSPYDEIANEAFSVWELFE